MNRTRPHAFLLLLLAAASQAAAFSLPKPPKLPKLPKLPAPPKVKVPKLRSLRLAPNQVIGGTPAHVHLAFDRSGLALPIFLPADPRAVIAIRPVTPLGAKTSRRTYMILTKPVRVRRRVEIAATWGGATRKATLTVTPRPPRSTGSSRRALLVLLENGGIVTTLKLCCKGLDLKKLPRVPVAICGAQRFALKPGENPIQLVRRLGDLIKNNPRALNPLNWRVRTETFETWLDHTSDSLVEDSVKAVQKAQTAGGKYHKVVTLEDNRFTTNRILAELRRLAPDYTIDIHILSHGGDGYFVGYRGHKVGQEFFDKLKQMRRELRGKPRIRAVYQMNCQSGTLVNRWRDAGAEVVNGTLGTANNYMPQQYFHFMGYWMNGKSFGDAISQSYKDAQAYTAPVYVHILRKPGYLIASIQQVKGRRTMRVTSR